MSVWEGCNIFTRFSVEVELLALSFLSSLAMAFAGPASADLTGANSQFRTESIPTQTGAFTFEFEATPSGNAIDGVTGVGQSSATAFSQIPVAIRFNSVGKIDAYSGSAYASSTYRYSANVTYRFRVLVDIPNQKYSVYVRVGAGTETRIGSALAFRKAAGTIRTFGYVVAWAFTGGSHQVKSILIRAGTQPPIVSPAPSPKPSPAPSPKPSPTPIPSPTSVGSDSPPLNSTLLAAWNHAVSGPLLARYNTSSVPSPWIVDFSGQDSVRVTDGNTKLHTEIVDGKVWDPLYTYTGNTDHLRSEISYRGSGAFAVGYTTIVEWRGYFAQNLPPVDTSAKSELTGPFQIHNASDASNASPMFSLGIDVARKKITLVRHSPSNQRLPSVDLADYSTFVNRSRTVRMYLNPSSSGTGSFKVEIDGVVVFTLAAGTQTSSTPGRDYVKFGLYDWGKAVASPQKGSRGQRLDLITESFKIFKQD